MLFEIREVYALRCKMEAQDEENSEAQRQNSENLEGVVRGCMCMRCAGVCVCRRARARARLSSRALSPAPRAVATPAAARMQ